MPSARRWPISGTRRRSIGGSNAPPRSTARLRPSNWWKRKTSNREGSGRKPRALALAHRAEADQHQAEHDGADRHHRRDRHVLLRFGGHLQIADLQLSLLLAEREAADGEGDEAQHRNDDAGDEQWVFHGLPCASGTARVGSAAVWLRNRRSPGLALA